MGIVTARDGEPMSTGRLLAHKVDGHGVPGRRGVHPQRRPARPADRDHPARPLPHQHGPLQRRSAERDDRPGEAGGYGHGKGRRATAGGRGRGAKRPRPQRLPGRLRVPGERRPARPAVRPAEAGHVLHQPADVRREARRGRRRPARRGRGARLQRRPGARGHSSAGPPRRQGALRRAGGLSRHPGRGGRPRRLLPQPLGLHRLHHPDDQPDDRLGRRRQPHRRTGARQPQAINAEAQRSCSTRWP